MACCCCCAALVFLPFRGAASTADSAPRASSVRERTVNILIMCLRRVGKKEEEVERMGKGKNRAREKRSEVKVRKKNIQRPVKS